jgi:hypothetical protein
MSAGYQYAGLHNAKQPGLSVQACAARLHHLAYAEERLMFLQAAHLVSTPARDVKALLARLQYEDCQHAGQLKTRVTELRVAHKKAFAAPDTPLALVFDEAMHAASSTELLASLVDVFKPALLQAYRSYLDATNGLADYPTVRILKSVIAEEEEGLALLAAVSQAVINTPAQKEEAARWVRHLQRILTAAGQVDGTGEIHAGNLLRVRGRTPYVIPRTFRRDDTFPRVWDFEHVDNQQIAPRLAQMISTRLSEDAVAEGVAFVLCETAGQPWAFYEDISRHLWDEMRHSLFGEAAAEVTLQDRALMPARDFEATYLFQMSPLELYALLGIGIEAALMKYPPGKREEYEFCRDSARHPLMTTFQDFDWADEVLHVTIARRQLKDWFHGDQQELIALAQKGLDFRTQTRQLHPPAPLPDLRHVIGAG